MAGVLLITALYWADYRDVANVRHAPLPTIIRYSILAMSIVGLLNASVLLGTWWAIRGPVARGLLLGSTGALTGAVGGAFIGSVLWENDGISQGTGAFAGAIVTMLVWSIGGAVGSITIPPTPAPSGGVAGDPGRPRRPLQQTLMGLAVLVAIVGATGAFDREYLHACTTKPLRGLEGWGDPSQADVRAAALARIAIQNGSVVIAVLMGLWVARRSSDGRASRLIPVAVVFLLLFALIAISNSMTMLGKIAEL